MSHGVDKVAIMKKPTESSFLLIVLASLALFVLTGCGANKNVFDKPQLNIYLLDLTTSGSTDDQLSRIYNEIEQDLTVNNLGKPFGTQDLLRSPVISKVFFVGTNSRFLLNFTLQDFDAIKVLYQKNYDDNNSTNAERIWNALSLTIKNTLTDSLESNSLSAISESNCKSIVDKQLEPIFSKSKRIAYVDRTCAVITFSSKNYLKMRKYIDLQRTRQNHSDVLGALASINDSIKQFLNVNPQGSVKVIMATDGDHNIPFDGYKDLATAISSNKDVCQLAKKVAGQKEFNILSDQRVDMSNKPGVGALGGDSSGTAAYAEKLSQFWNCFPK